MGKEGRIKALETMTDEEYENVKAFDQGMKARQSGRKKSDCPYGVDTRKEKEWIDGYEVMALSEAEVVVENA